MVEVAARVEEIGAGPEGAVGVEEALAQSVTDATKSVTLLQTVQIKEVDLLPAALVEEVAALRELVSKLA